MPLPAAELTALQAAAATLLDTTANIQRNTNSTFDVGQPGETWTAVATGIAAGLAAPTQAMQLEYADMIANQQAWLVKFAAGQSVQTKDRVVINGLTLEVQAIISSTAHRSYATLTRVLASKIG